MKSPKVIVTAVVVFAMLYSTWEWTFCRFYVGPNQMAIITMKMFGSDLEPGQILARKGQKGIQEEVLGEGRHFLNPIVYDWVIRPIIQIPAGKAGVVTSKIGSDLPEGEFLANPGQKGIWRNALGPGKYRLNPFGYSVDIVDAVSIPIGYCGVVTSLAGTQAPAGQFATVGQKGVQRDILQPGLYYINPKSYKVDVLEIGVNQVSLLGKGGGEVVTKGKIEVQNAAMEALQSKTLETQQRQRLDYYNNEAKDSNVGSLFKNALSGRLAPEDSEETITAGERGAKNAPAVARRPQKQQAVVQSVQQEAEAAAKKSDSNLGLAEFIEFPSRDGFRVSLDMTVEIELTPADIAWVFSQYGDLPAVVDKIILPQITSVTRNKGSEYGARDFIVGEGREKFQNELTKALAETLAQKRITVHNALIRHVEVPPEILAPIQQASVAIEQNLTNKEKQNTAKKQAELNTELSLIDQRRQEVAQETRKLRAEIGADQEKQVATIKAGTIKRAAEIARDTARLNADTVRKLSLAEAEAIKKVEGEKAAGIQLKGKAFDDPAAFALWQLAMSLNKDVSLNIIHAGTGTLWTDLQNPRLADLKAAEVIQDAEASQQSQPQAAPGKPAK